MKPQNPDSMAFHQKLGFNEKSKFCVIPMEYRKFDGVSGDLEQEDSQIYNYIS